MMSIKDVAIESMFRMAVSSLGIDADSLLSNIRQFQEYCTNAIQHHDRRLVALESGLREMDAKLSRVLAILEAENAARIPGGESGAKHIPEAPVAGSVAAASNEFYKRLGAVNLTVADEGVEHFPGENHG
jgi:hypothetical protein